MHDIAGDRVFTISNLSIQIYVSNNQDLNKRNWFCRPKLKNNNKNVIFAQKPVLAM